MNWKTLILPPVAIYAAIFLVIAGMIGFGVDQDSYTVWIVGLIVSVIGLYIATQKVAPKDIQEGMKYGLAWVVVFVILDLLLTIPFDASYFSDWRSYVGYALTFLIPALGPKKK